LEGADPRVISDHFTQFILSTGGLKLRRSFHQLIWVLSVWIFWNECNSRLFKNKESIIFLLL